MVVIKKPTRMNDNDNNNKRTAEIKGGKITPFAGKRETLEKFLETIGLHLILNRVKDDKDKIAFTLTYLEGGDANSWRAAFLKRSITAGENPILESGPTFFENYGTASNRMTKEMH